MSTITLADHSPTDRIDPRTPTADLAAEQAVLGAMLLSKDAIADVVESLKVDDFYRPAHATVYSAILDL
jgi:replicative DNA helicase